MTFAEYRDITHPVPYILTGASAQGQLLYYGAAHVYEADHPQIAEIQRRWEVFRPTYALNEGGTPPVYDTVAETVGRNGEAALVRWLARRDGVIVETFEPSREQLAHAVGDRFTVEQQKVSAVVRQLLLQQQRSDASFRAPDLEAEVTRVLTIIGRTPGLEGPPTTLGEFRASVARVLPQLQDWNKVPSEWFDPAAEPPPTWINELSRASSDYRDEVIIEKVLGKVREGHRVFAVVGASHVVMQERILRSRLSRTSIISSD
jgi:hypothetical protein